MVMSEYLHKHGRDFLLLHISFLVYSLSSVASKCAATQESLSPSFFGYAALMFLIMCVYALLWQQALKRFPLSKAYSSKGVVILWNMLWAALFFAERITWMNLLGSVIIITGIVVVSSNED